MKKSNIINIPFIYGGEVKIGHKTDTTKINSVRIYFL